MKNLVYLGLFLMSFGYLNISFAQYNNYNNGGGYGNQGGMEGQQGNTGAGQVAGQMEKNSNDTVNLINQYYQSQGINKKVPTMKGSGDQQNGQNPNDPYGSGNQGGTGY